MLSKINKSNKGFTIIEVMIVLAIAGLIILIVLLAVPALQRNSRNAAMKQDVSAIAGGVSEFAANNDGATPTDPPTTTNTGATYTINNASGTATDVKVQASDNITSAQHSLAGVTGSAGSILVDFGVSCTGGSYTGPPNAPVFTPITPSSRATAIIYSTEVAGGLQIKCLDT